MSQKELSIFPCKLQRVFRVHNCSNCTFPIITSNCHSRVNSDNVICCCPTCVLTQTTSKIPCLISPSLLSILLHLPSSAASFLLSDSSPFSLPYEHSSSPLVLSQFLRLLPSILRLYSESRLISYSSKWSISLLSSFEAANF